MQDDNRSSVPHGLGVFVATASALLLSGSFAATWIVDQGGGADATTIQGGVDLAAVVLMLLIQLAVLLLITLLRGMQPHLGVLLIIAIAELLSLLLNVFLVTIIIQVILSWVNPGTYNPVTGLLYNLNEPLLRPARRYIPPISGLDLSPIVVLIGIQLLKMLLIPPLLGIAS